MLLEDISKVSDTKLYDFFTLVNKDFEPNLNHKIEFMAYIRKIKTFANVAIYLNDGNITGLIVYYTNLEIAQITLIATAPDFRNQGIGQCLINHVVNKISKPIRIITWKSNRKAIQITVYRSRH